MTNMHRRGFLLGMGGASLTVTASQNPGSTAASAPAAADVTRKLARRLVSAKVSDLPAAVRKEGKRTLLNYVACALGGSHHEAVDAAVAALTPFSGRGQASLLGRKERVDPLTATLINGISSHVL